MRYILCETDAMGLYNDPGDSTDKEGAGVLSVNGTMEDEPDKDAEGCVTSDEISGSLSPRNSLYGLMGVYKAATHINEGNRTRLNEFRRSSSGKKVNLNASNRKEVSDALKSTTDGRTRNSLQKLLNGGKTANAINVQMSRMRNGQASGMPEKTARYLKGGMDSISSMDAAGEAVDKAYDTAWMKDGAKKNGKGAEPNITYEY